MTLSYSIACPVVCVVFIRTRIENSEGKNVEYIRANLTPIIRFSPINNINGQLRTIRSCHFSSRPMPVIRISSASVGRAGCKYLQRPTENNNFGHRTFANGFEPGWLNGSVHKHETVEHWTSGINNRLSRSTIRYTHSPSSYMLC